ncbi:myogenesis-regulating glycosidase-like isoform X2 [Apostichopus japonicus]
MSSQPGSRFTVEAAIIDEEVPTAEEPPSHSINGTQPNQGLPTAKVDLTAPIRLLKTPREIKLKFTVMCLFVLILVGTILILVYYKEEPFHYVLGSLTYYVDKKEMVIDFEGRERLRGQIGLFAPMEAPAACSMLGDSERLCLSWKDYGKLRIKYDTNLSHVGIDCYKVSWETFAPERSIKDCFSMTNSHWYGGGVTKDQNVPIESMNIPMTAFVTSDRRGQFGSVVERYWLSTRNVSIKVADRSPLLVSMDNDEQRLCLESMHWESIHHDHNSSDSHLEYAVCANNDLLKLFNSTKAFPIPPIIPNTLLLEEPLWSLYVNNDTRPFHVVQELYDLHPVGYIDIRSGFAVNEGDLTFKGTPLNDSFVPFVHRIGLRVMASVTPFVSVDSVAFTSGALRGDLVMDPRGEVPGLTMWADKIGGVIDFTDNTAVLSYRNSLRAFKDSQGLESLTFDYGEASYLPYGYQINTELDDPSQFTHSYIEIANSVTETVVTRSAYESQHIPIVIRTYPKEISWDTENGFASVIPSIINLGLIGYPFMALDLKEFSSEQVDKEMLLSYIQLSACLPVMQIPTTALEYGPEVKDLIHEYIDFHQNVIIPMVSDLGVRYLRTGLPIIRPLWWLEHNADTASINSQFLVGDDILVAPKVAPGHMSRQVYLPSGKWQQPGTGVLYTGGQWEDITFQSETIPYLIRV